MANLWPVDDLDVERLLRAHFNAVEARLPHERQMVVAWWYLRRF
jgi:hypothetical protein